jgi:hypothetical protein
MPAFLRSITRVIIPALRADSSEAPFLRDALPLPEERARFQPLREFVGEYLQGWKYRAAGQLHPIISVTNYGSCS